MEFSLNWSAFVMNAKTFIFLFVMALAACGGGGSSSGVGTSNPGGSVSPPDLSGTADGFWAGRNTLGYNLGGVFLDNGDY